MSLGPTFGYVINLFAYGFISIGIGKAWDILGQTMNQLNSLHLMTQDGMNVFYILTWVFYALGMYFLLAGGYNLINESKKEYGRNV